MSSLKCKLINARSICNKLPDLHYLLDNEQVDILLITETWLRNDISNTTVINNRRLSIFRKDRINSLGGGVCIITNDNTVKAVNVPIAQSFSDSDIVCIDIVNSDQPLRIICCYRPPSSDTDSVSVESMNRIVKCLEILCDTDSTVVLAGDFNLPFIDWSCPVFISDCRRCSTQFNEFVGLFSLHQFIDEYTRLNQNSNDFSGSILDLVFCNDNFVVQNVCVMAPFSSSDHSSIVFNLLCHISVSDHNVQYRNFNDADWDAIKLFFNNVDWDDVFDDCSSPVDLYNSFSKVVHESIDQFVPVRNTNNRRNNKSSSGVPYPASVKKLLRKKLCVWKRFKAFRTDSLRVQYRDICSRCRRAIYNSLLHYEESIIDSNNLGRFFRYSNSKLIGHKNVGPLQQSDGTITVDPTIKASLLSDHFNSNFTYDNGVIPSSVHSNDQHGLSNIIFSPNLVRKVISKLKSNSSGGPDGIPPVFIKNCNIFLCGPLSFLFQQFFENSYIPPIWLKAFITPVFKKGDSTKPNNYRPISLTCNLCKIMECIIKDQVVSYLLSKGLISKQQHAFLCKRSTVTNLLESVHDWTVHLQHKYSVDVIYIDFSHAFDCVVHSKLLSKLSSFGIQGLLLYWIEAFLSNRTQCVVIEHCFSDWCPVISGVPQGSVLGPLLFVLYIDDIGIICSADVTHQLFADDLKLYTSVVSGSTGINLQESLDKLCVWCNNWQLTVNIAKCYVHHLGKNNQRIPYYFSGSQIPVSNVVVDLGISVDCNLKFDSHINNIISKSYSRIGALFKGFCSRSPSVLKKAYITYVRPILEYASSVWNPYLLKHITCIERVQRRFTKRIPALHDMSYSERLAALDLESLEIRRLRADLTLYYKILNNLVHISRNLLPSAPTSPIVHTRSVAPRLLRPKFTTFELDNNFFDRCVSCWNYLPDIVVNSTSLMCFKKNLSSVDLSLFLRYVS